jgi:Ni/Fe-hydrogenase subunit HybB-like protein
MSTSEPSDRLLKARSTVWLVLALGGLLVWLFLLRGDDPGRAWRSLLINFLFFSSLSAGLVVWPALVRTCNGRWQEQLEHLAGAGIAFSIPSLVALVALWIGSPGWAPWYQKSLHQGLWLDNSFLFGRDLAALLIFWGLALYYLRQRGRGEGSFCGVALTLVYCLVFSLLGFDLVMALDPQWYSNLAGGYFFISGLYIAITGWALLASRHPGASPDQLHDLGKLMVAFSLMTTYLMYAHLLPFWYENLPQEIRFLVPRMNFQPWKSVSYLLLCLVYFGPLVLLLTERAKRDRRILGAVTLLVLVGLWLERWWLVAPTFDPALRLGLSELSLAAAFLGVLGFGMEQYHKRVPRQNLSGDE